jgi:carboxylate-amine ligase
MREMDAQAPLPDVAAVAALAHALARAEAERAPGAATEPAEALAWSSFRAARDGLDATLVVDGSARPLREVARAAVALAKPHADELGAGDALDGIERILREGGGADRQRAAHAAGGLDGLLRWLVEKT